MVLLAWVYLLSLPVMPWVGGLPPSLPEQVTREGWWGFAGILGVTTVMAYGLNTFALARVPASVTAIYIYLQPLIAAGAGVWILGEELGPELIPAGVLLFAGIALVTWPAKWGLPKWRSAKRRISTSAEAEAGPSPAGLISENPSTDR
jgi:drug/metabolite transporter (DMT)-like permease